MALTRIINGIPLSHLAVGISFGMFLVVLPALFDPKKFRSAIEEFLNAGNSVMRMSGVLHLLPAFLILNSKWTIGFGSARAVVQSILPILGYLLLVRGTVCIWFPNFVREKGRHVLAKPFFLSFFTIVGLLAALGFGYLGMWVY